MKGLTTRGLTGLRCWAYALRHREGPSVDCVGCGGTKFR